MLTCYGRRKCIYRVYFIFLFEKHTILAINSVIAHIAISITSSPSGAGFHVMRWVKYGGW